MRRREFFAFLNLGLLGVLTSSGCRGRQHAHVLARDEEDMVGSHEAGAETWKPLMDEALARLLARQESVIQQASTDGSPATSRICFVGVENKSSEEIGDFKEQIFQHLDSMLNESQVFKPISRRSVESGLRQCRLAPEDLLVPSNRRLFSAAMEQLQQPFDYLLFATITSGTTRNNESYQRDYVLTLELVNIETGDFDKESATLRKGYHKTRLGKLRNYGL